MFNKVIKQIKLDSFALYLIDRLNSINSSLNGDLIGYFRFNIWLLRGSLTLPHITGMPAAPSRLANKISKKMIQQAAIKSKKLI